MRAALILAVLLVVGSAPAYADGSTLAAVEAFGLLGQWSPDCRQGPSNDNPRVYYDVTAAGLINHRVSNDGRTAWLSDTIADATILAGDQIRFSVVRNGAVTFIVTVRREAGKMRTMESIGINGVRYYYEGVERHAEHGVRAVRWDGVHIVRV
jgi:hypothetical protein